MSDSFDLNRFVAAQAAVYRSVVDELRAGRKTGHWMWFVFPQIAGLGRSATSREFAISSMAEARAYDSHAVLGRRLRECTGLVLAVDSRSAEDIFGGIDSRKFRSCMTLFAMASGDPELFRQALAKYFAGRPDPLTAAILAAGPGAG